MPLPADLIDSKFKCRFVIWGDWMNIFDRVASSAFKETDEGLCVFYPDGILSKGKVVPSLELKAKILLFQKISIMIGIGFVAAGLFIPVMATLVFVVILLAVYYFKRNQLIGSLANYDQKLTVSEAYAKAQFPVWYRNVIFCLSMAMAFIFLVLIFTREAQHPIFWMLFLFSCVGFFIVFLLKRFQSGSSNKS